MKRTIVLCSILLLLVPLTALAQDACEGNFDCDQDVDGTDAALFKSDFGRSGFKNPCPTSSDCCVGSLSPLGRWCDQFNGTIKDMTTGLVWLKDAGWGSTKTWANCTTWDDAHTKAGMLKSGMAGLSDGSMNGDWRLPRSTELWGIIEGVEYIRTTQMYFFTNVQEWYWSSTTTDLNYPNYTTANAARMTVGVSAGALLKTGNSLGTWPVRGGQKFVQILQ